MDADIAAADSLALERIQAQEYRNDVADLAAHRAAVQAHQESMRAQFAAFMDWIKAEYLTIPDAAEEYRRDMALAIAANYMKPTTGTLPETIAADASNDALRLKAAVTAAVA